VGDGGYILDHVYFQSGGLEGANSGFPAGARTLDHNFDFFQAMFHGFLGRLFGGHLGSKGGAFPGALKAYPAGAGPGYGIAPYVGNGDDGIVKSGFDVGNARLYIFAFTPFGPGYATRH
jgi:hypothetical protein